MDVQGATPTASGDLRPFVPRGSLNWLASEPDRRHRRFGGSLVFVDISGFTAMSERLARLGKVGAEEVTDLLNQTFSRLLAVAYEDDGSLLKFGGDALLLSFAGHEHVTRAVHAAWGMRRKLRELQPLSSSAGQVRLRMSVGVHTGEVDEFLVGSGHRELFLLGEVLSTTVEMESAAGPGQIMISHAVATALGDQVRTSEQGPGLLLRGDPPVPQAPPSETSKEGTQHVAPMLLSSVVAKRLATGVPMAEHRPSVIGFIKFTGTDRLLATDGPEALADALHRLTDIVDDAVARDDVCLLATDVDADGGKFILTAGVPSSTEFDGERMLRALRAIVESDPPLPLKIGVNFGPVFAGVIGPWFRLTYTIIGDAVNLAARVMGKAEPGQILATPEVLNRSQALFDIEELEPFAVKGKKHPVRAIKVGRVQTARLRRPRARFRLAGRKEELRALLGELDAAADGPGRMAQLLGPAGIGKSRLVDEVHERRPAADLHMVGCNQYESTTPYHSAGQLVRSLLALPPTAGADELRATITDRAPGLESSLPLLGDVVGIEIPDNSDTRDLTAGFRAEKAVEATCGLLEWIVPEPAILVIEDLHWVDPESRKVVLALAHSVLPRRRWLLLLTSRNRLVLDPNKDLGETILELEPLGDKDAREFVYAAVEEGLVSLERGQQMLDKAGGNPFFLQELLRVSLDTGGGDGDLPDDVDALIQTQLDQLPAEDRELLGYAAVLGAEIEPELFEATTGMGIEDQATAFANLFSFVEPTGTGSFRFRHALVHDGAYGRLPFRRRRELHLKAVEALEVPKEGDRRPDLLALHTYHARDWEHARRYSLEAAELAAARYANLTAAEHYRHAIESGRWVRMLTDDDLATTWERLGDVLMTASDYDGAVEAYRKAKRTAGPAKQVHLCGQIGQLRERQGQYQQSLQWLSRALRLDEKLGAGETGRLLVESAIVRLRQGKSKVARQLVDRAEKLDVALPVRARVAYARAWAAMIEGEDGSQYEFEMRDLCEDAGDIIGLSLAYNQMSLGAGYRGDWDLVVTACERAAELRRRIGDGVAAAVAGSNLAEILGDRGDFERAIPLLEEARTVCAAHGYRSSLYFAEMMLGRVWARLGQYEEAQQLLKNALAGFEDLTTPHLLRDTHRGLAELAIYRGDLDAVLAQADAVDQWADRGIQSFRSMGDRYRLIVHLLRGQLDDALRLADRLEAHLGDDHDYEAALSQLVIALVREEATDGRAAETRARATGFLDHFGLVVAPELLLFGPDSPRTPKGDA